MNRSAIAGLAGLRHRLHVLREKMALGRLPAVACHSESLRRLTVADLTAIFGNADIDREWTGAAEQLAAACAIADGATGGVNPGDRRAVWYLVKGLGAGSVLEIGTHVGASTLHLAAALRSNARQNPSIELRMVTVDVEDVNSDVSGSWKRYGLRASPRQMLQSIACGDFVTFVTGTSLAYLDRCRDRFDFVFLDGSHDATTVYQELPRVLNLLNPGGVVLLHDYFPGNRPLWANGSLIAGPWLAMTRLRNEGAPLTVVPLGDLPWPTKQGSSTTSLALVTPIETI